MPPLKQARKLTNRCPEHKETAPAGELKPQVIGLSSESIRHDHSRFTSLQLRFINFRSISPVGWVAREVSTTSLCALHCVPTIDCGEMEHDRPVLDSDRRGTPAALFLNLDLSKCPPCNRQDRCGTG